jgi:hypothetical protein
MSIAVLQIRRAEEDSWDFLPQDLWMALLDRFVLEYCSGIGFSGIKHSEEVSRIEIFSDWQPQYVGPAFVRISWRNEQSKLVTKVDHFALFEYSKELHKRLVTVHNTEWKSYDERYPADELYFFQQEHVLMIAVPYEASIMFCDLNDEQIDHLRLIDERIGPNLHFLTDREVFSGIVSG